MWVRCSILNEHNLVGITGLGGGNLIKCNAFESERLSSMSTQHHRGSYPLLTYMPLDMNFLINYCWSCAGQLFVRIQFHIFICVGTNSSYNQPEYWLNWINFIFVINTFNVKLYPSPLCNTENLALTLLVKLSKENKNIHSLSSGLLSICKGFL